MLKHILQHLLYPLTQTNLQLIPSVCCRWSEKVKMLHRHWGSQLTAKPNNYCCYLFFWSNLQLEGSKLLILKPGYQHLTNQSKLHLHSNYFTFKEQCIATAADIVRVVHCTQFLFLHKFFIKITYCKWLSMTRVKGIDIQLFQFIYTFVKVIKIIDITETCEIVN